VTIFCLRGEVQQSQEVRYYMGPLLVVTSSDDPLPLLDIGRGKEACKLFRVQKAQMESIYNLVPKPHVEAVKEEMYRSKHDPKAIVSYSTFGCHGTHANIWKVGLNELNKVQKIAVSLPVFFFLLFTFEYLWYSFPFFYNATILPSFVSRNDIVQQASDHLKKFRFVLQTI